ncbi:hypothetical protein ACFQY3_13575 [Paenibacillus farraposensis]
MKISSVAAIPTAISRWITVVGMTGKETSPYEPDEPQTAKMGQ